MADTVLYAPFFQGEDANGNPLAGAKLYFYLANTTTKITIYQDALAATPHQNPVVADSAGMFAPIFLAAGQALFKTELTTSAGSVIQTADGISSVQRYSATFADLIAKWTPASASGPASLDFAEDADNGTNRVRVTVPSTLAADYSFVLPAANVTLDSFIVTLLNSTSLATAQAAIGVREVLTANRTYYVRDDASDSNNGLANTSGGAFLTYNKARDVIAALDRSIYNVTVTVGAGTYTGGLSISGWGPGTGTVTFNGAGSTTIVSTAGAAPVLAKNAAVTVTNMKVESTGGQGLRAEFGGFITFSDIEFGVCSAAHIWAQEGGKIKASGNYSITGGTGYHFFARFGANIDVFNRTVTLTGTPAFSTAFAGVATNGTMETTSITFSGAATGSRYQAGSGGVINTGGGGASYFPGNAAGTGTNFSATPWGLYL